MVAAPTCLPSAVYTSLRYQLIATATYLPWGHLRFAKPRFEDSAVSRPEIIRANLNAALNSPSCLFGRRGDLPPLRYGISWSPRRPISGCASGSLRSAVAKCLAVAFSVAWRTTVIARGCRA